MVSVNILYYNITGPRLYKGYVDERNVVMRRMIVFYHPFLNVWDTQKYPTFVQIKDKRLPI